MRILLEPEVLCPLLGLSVVVVVVVYSLKQNRFSGVIQVIDLRVMLFIQSSHYFDLIFVCL